MWRLVMLDDRLPLGLRAAVLGSSCFFVHTLTLEAVIEEIMSPDFSVGRYSND